MKLLALETSTKKFSLAITDKDAVLFRHTLPQSTVLSSSIIPAIQKALKDVRMRLSDLDGFAVGLGPGSFTSLRVGLATIKGLSYSIKKPILGISSLDVLAMNIPHSDIPSVCTLCDARRDLVYWCLYERDGARITQKKPYALSDITTVMKKIKKPTIFVGDGIQLYKDSILSAGKKNEHHCVSDERKWYPNAQQLAVLAMQRFKGTRYTDGMRLVPLYLYPDDCQVVRTQSRKKT